MGLALARYTGVVTHRSGSIGEREKEKKRPCQVKKWNMERS
jgi:hypothetical protein